MSDKPPTTWKEKHLAPTLHNTAGTILGAIILAIPFSFVWQTARDFWKIPVPMSSFVGAFFWTGFVAWLLSKKQRQKHTHSVAQIEQAHSEAKANLDQLRLEDIAANRQATEEEAERIIVEKDHAIADLRKADADNLQLIAQLRESQANDQAMIAKQREVALEMNEEWARMAHESADRVEASYAEQIMALRNEIASLRTQIPPPKYSDPFAPVEGKRLLRRKDDGLI